MTVEISYDIFFTDGDGSKRSIASSVSTFSQTSEKGKPYAVCEFVVDDLYVDPALVKDGVERIKAVVQIDGVQRTTRYMIDDIRYDNKKTVKIIGKSAGCRMTEAYAGRGSIDIVGDDSSVILQQLAEPFGLVIDFGRYTPFSISNSAYHADDSTPEEAIYDLLSVTGAEIFFKDGSIVVQDCQTIAIDDEPVSTFTSLKHMNEFSVSANDISVKINEIYINSSSSETIYSEPRIVLSIDKSPQPLSPTTVLTFTDDNTGEVYKVSPVQSVGKVYYSPLIGDVSINGHPYTKLSGYGVIDTIEVSGERVVTTRGGIRSINGVEIDGVAVTNYTYEPLYNTLLFDTEISGLVKVSYDTDIYRLVFAASSDQYRAVDLTFEHFDRYLHHVHRYEAVDYWPLDYDFRLDLIADWAVDENDAINASGELLSVDAAGYETVIGSWQADAVGELDVSFADYGVYALSLSGYDNLYIQFFVNKFDIGLTKVRPAT